MPQATMAPVQERVLGFLEQRPGETFTLAKIAQATQLKEDQLKGILGSMTKNGAQVQRIGTSSYRYSHAPLPQPGETFTGQVVAHSYQAGVIIRDSSGGSWKIEPV